MKENVVWRKALDVLVGHRKRDSECLRHRPGRGRHGHLRRLAAGRARETDRASAEYASRKKHKDEQPDGSIAPHLRNRTPPHLETKPR